MKQSKTQSSRQSQLQAFKKAARALECDESEESFDKALGKIGRNKVPPKKDVKTEKA